MPRGTRSEVGTERVNALGYTQVKIGEGHWVGKHILVLEEKIGRKLRPGERAIFKDRNKANLSPDNIELSASTSFRSIKAKIAKLQAEIEDRQALIKDLEAQLEEQAEQTG